MHYQWTGLLRESDESRTDLKTIKECHDASGYAFLGKCEGEKPMFNKTQEQLNTPVDGVDVYVLQCMQAEMYNVSWQCKPGCGDYYIKDDSNFICSPCLSETFGKGSCFNNITSECDNFTITFMEGEMELCYTNDTCDHKQ